MQRPGFLAFGAAQLRHHWPTRSVSNPDTEGHSVNSWDRHVLDSYYSSALRGYAGRRLTPSAARYSLNDRIRLIPELGGAIVTVKRVDPTGEALSVELPGGKVIAVGSDAIRRPMEWKPGDVMIVRYAEGGTPWTYVRGARNWPGDNRAARSDETMTKLYYEGKAVPVLQAGGEPFAAERLA